MPEHFTKGQLLMLFSSICFAAVAYFAKLATTQLPGAQVALTRFAAGVVAPLTLAGLPFR